MALNQGLTDCFGPLQLVITPVRPSVRIHISASERVAGLLLAYRLGERLGSRRKKAKGQNNCKIPAGTHVVVCCDVRWRGGGGGGGVACHLANLRSLSKINIPGKYQINFYPVWLIVI